MASHNDMMSNTVQAPHPPRLSARYFDGRSSRPHEVEIWIEAGQLHILTPHIHRTLEARQVQWPERTQHGPRLALLPDGGSLLSSDAAAWDAWRRSSGAKESLVVRVQQSWRGLIVSLVLLLGLTSAAYVWGLPWAARQAAHHLPDRIEQQVGETVLDQVQPLVQASQLSAAEQQAIEQAWHKVLQAHTKAQAARGITVRPTRLLMRHSSKIGPNALALPGGSIVLTDDMVRLLQHDTRVISGVLAHELGHVQHRHGMRMLVQVGVLGFVTSALWGDYSGMLATIPLWMGQAHYSREAEREADAYSVTALRDAGISPAVMLTLFDRFDLFRRYGKAILEPTAASQPPDCARDAAGPKPTAHTEKREQQGIWELGFASHPSDQDRISFFRQASP